MDDSGVRHFFPEINPGGKVGIISVILLLEVGVYQALVGGLQTNDVLILLTNPGETEFLVTLL